ncbi:MAG TPA: hypothetical protein VGY91_11015 [Chthoniobacterales bacterium]|nr:hypothetical protein [Chthoniobacterales bacterium]
MIKDLPNSDNGRGILRAFGQEAHVLISSEQSGNAFCLLRFFAGPENTIVSSPSAQRSGKSRSRISE